MNDNIRNELIDKLKLFLEEKTYTYIQDFHGYNFNGFVKEINDKRIIFEDDVLGKIPILIIVINPEKLTYSTRTRGGEER